jgi:hypothetical protein
MFPQRYFSNSLPRIGALFGAGVDSHSLCSVRLRSCYVAGFYSGELQGYKRIASASAFILAGTTGAAALANYVGAVLRPLAAAVQTPEPPLTAPVLVLKDWPHVPMLISGESQKFNDSALRLFGKSDTQSQAFAGL